MDRDFQYCSPIFVKEEDEAAMKKSTKYFFFLKLILILIVGSLPRKKKKKENNPIVSDYESMGSLPITFSVQFHFTQIKIK